MKESKYIQKSIKPNAMHFSLQTFVIGTILAITFFLFLIDNIKLYRSTITILVSAKSENAIMQENQIISNIIEFPHMLSFYDRMLKQNPDVTDIAAGKSQDERKKTWNRLLSIEQTKKDASVINVSIKTSRETDADKLVKKTTRTLFDTVGIYYDIKDDIDMRIVDGPISHSDVAGWYWIIPLSICMGFLVAFLLQYAFSKSMEIFSYKTGFFEKGNVFEKNNLFDFIKKTHESSEQEIKSLEDLYMYQQSEDAFFIKKRTEEESELEKKIPEELLNAPQIAEMKKLTKMIQQDKYPNFPEMPVRTKQKAVAPDNLPVSDDVFFSNIDNFSNHEKSDETMKINHEPTEEELRKRLNQLLRGEL